MPQKRVNLGLRAKPGDAEARELARVALPVSSLAAERERDQGVVATDDAAERLAVPVPQLLAQHDPASRPANEARQPDAARQVEPDDRVRPLEDQVAELAPVRAVDHPSVGRDDRLHAAPELGGVELGPPGLVMDRVELDVGSVERCRQRTRHCRLAAPTCTCDHHDATHDPSSSPQTSARLWT